jgi:hypothetical protein
MMHTSKLLLVPPGSTQDSGEENMMSALDTEMKKILESKSLPTSQKLAEYNQILHRYLKTTEKRKQPIQIEIQEPQKPAFDDSEVLEGLPLRNMKSAKNLLTAIKKNTRLSWSDSGELVVDGMPIDGSNIIDLIHDFSRERRPHNPVTGAEVLAKALKKSHVPLEYVGNKHRHKLLDKTADIILATPHRRPPITPRRTRQIAVRDFNWDEL